jgi:hypothetical protein
MTPLLSVDAQVLKNAALAASGSHPSNQRAAAEESIPGTDIN